MAERHYAIQTLDGWVSVYRATTEEGARYLAGRSCSAWLAAEPGREVRTRAVADGWVVETREVRR